MSLLSRRDYMSQLAIEDSDICHEPMSNPARTNCRHFYCFECLKAWLESNNTCPTCRTQLFVETNQITEQNVERQSGFLPPVPARRLSRSGELEATVSRLEGAPISPGVVERMAGEKVQQPPQPTEQHVEPHDQSIAASMPDHGELSYNDIQTYANQLQAQSGTQTREATFNGTAMFRLFERLFPESATLPDWNEGLTTHNVLYTFVLSDGTAWLVYTSGEVPARFNGSGSGPQRDELIRAWTRRQSEWADKVRECLNPAEQGRNLLVELQRLLQEDAELPFNQYNIIF
ncbi:hypothetical protein CBER1_04506 [Cercospora berteroae]|uniref:RING-type domain-containing protein n=1 Tax=Cercospora berteroae TaxID=357750 RepID=A0A2S6CF61_9PEZI|nr:hypothetical protein CBER1_04506 [Cercospora berteroae]